MTTTTDRITCFGVTYVIRYDRSDRSWYIAREDGTTYEPVSAATRDLAILFLGLTLANNETF